MLEVAVVVEHDKPARDDAWRVQQEVQQHIAPGVAAIDVQERHLWRQVVEALGTQLRIPPQHQGVRKQLLLVVTELFKLVGQLKGINPDDAALAVADFIHQHQRLALPDTNLDPVARNAFDQKRQVTQQPRMIVKRQFLARHRPLRRQRALRLLEVLADQRPDLGDRVIFTLIAGSKLYDYQEVESEEKKATRRSLFHPCFEVDGIEFMALFNDKNRHYRGLVEMVRF
jgi:hypothetical protein